LAEAVTISTKRPHRRAWDHISTWDATPRAHLGQLPWSGDVILACRAPTLRTLSAAMASLKLPNRVIGRNYADGTPKGDYVHCGRKGPPKTASLISAAHRLMVATSGRSSSKSTPTGHPARHVLVSLCRRTACLCPGGFLLRLKAASLRTSRFARFPVGVCWRMVG
jgi:hypothetical protein